MPYFRVTTVVLSLARVNKMSRPTLSYAVNPSMDTVSDCIPAMNDRAPSLSLHTVSINSLLMLNDALVAHAIKSKSVSPSRLRLERKRRRGFLLLSLKWPCFIVFGKNGVGFLHPLSCGRFFGGLLLLTIITRFVFQLVFAVHGRTVAVGFCGVRMATPLSIRSCPRFSQPRRCDRWANFCQQRGDNLKFHTPKIPHPPRDNVDDVKFLWVTCVGLGPFA